MKKHIVLFFFLFQLTVLAYSQSATKTIPVSIGLPCGAGDGILDSIMYFVYNRNTETINKLSTCRPGLSSPGISAFNTSVSFNPADGYLYFVRYNSSGSYIWRWDPQTCPGTIPVYQFYPGQSILGLDFDATGMGYQIIFTGSSAPYGIALQKVDFTTETFGPIVPIDLQGKQINTQNGDLVITPGNQFLMVWDNLYFSLNYQDYNTATPLKATYINKIALTGSTKLVGLAYAQGKLVGSASNCGYYDFNILTGKLTDLTEGSGLQYSTDMTNITSGVGAAKKLVSATPVSAGVYDLTYDIKINNYGDYPISNLKVIEDLTTIHPLGAAAISNVSVQWVNNPAGIALNASYNGVTDKNLISTSPTQTLPVFPKSQNTCTIRVKFRLSSIVSGVTYYNNAKVTGVGYNGAALMDSSTNGSNPDLNDNFIPDDAGENQPTPFSVSVASEIPPCTTINTVLYNQDFGSGAGLTSTMPGSSITEYTAGTNPLDEETYTITNNAINANSDKYLSLNDNSGNNNGRMLVVNADVKNSILFQDEVNVTCVNSKYTFLVSAANVMNDTYKNFCGAFGGTSQPMLTLIVRDAVTDKIIASSTTSAITSSSWGSYGMKWAMPAGTTKVQLQIYNAAEGGCGNAVAIDNIQFGLCDPTPVLQPSLLSAGCTGNDITLQASLSDTTGMSSTLTYVWQSYSAATSVWTDIPSATSASYTIPYNTTNHNYYRMIVAPDGNLGNAACQFISNQVQPTWKDSSFQPSSIKRSKLTVCPGEKVMLTIEGGSLGTNAAWKWYTDSCSGTFLGTGDTVFVTPSPAKTFTTYFVSAAGDCNVTQCLNTPVFQSCLLANETAALEGNIDGNFSNLHVKIITADKIKSFELERSFDGTTFYTVKANAVDGYVNNNGYNLQDKIAALPGNEFYYRIKVITANDQSFYSKVLLLKNNTQNTKLTISPNPANNVTRLIFFEPSAQHVEIKLYNMQGQLLQTNHYSATEGTNNYTLSNLNRFVTGTYTVVITDAAKTVYTKLVISK